MPILVIIDKTRVNINYYLCVIFKGRLERDSRTAALYVTVIVMRVCIYEIGKEKKCILYNTNINNNNNANNNNNDRYARRYIHIYCK